MAIGLIGKKLGMTQIFGDDGTRVPVTVIQAEPATVLQVRTREVDGYSAVQLGAGEKKVQRLSKAAIGHRKKAGKMASILREFRDAGDRSVGDVFRVEDLFSKGDLIDVTGTSKGRGTAGVMKRHGFSGSKASHGAHEYFRHGGSIGSCAYPGRVFKGKRMAGHYGATRVTQQNLEIIAVRPEDNLVLVRGAVPGSKNGTVILKAAIKRRETADV